LPSNELISRNSEIKDLEIWVPLKQARQKLTSLLEGGTVRGILYKSSPKLS
jgi:hypothetical protein